MLLASNELEKVYMATLHGNFAKVRECLPNKEILETRFVDGLTLLHVAASKDHVNIARLLIESGIDIDVLVSCFFLFYFSKVYEEHKRNTRGTQEEHKKNTRRTQAEHKSGSRHKAQY